MPKTKTIVLVAIAALVVLAVYYMTRPADTLPAVIAPAPITRRTGTGTVRVTQTGRELAGYDFTTDPRGIGVYA